MTGETKRTTDHQKIKKWVQERDGHPAAVKGKGTDDEPGVLRIDFPGYSGEESLEKISWETFFNKFEMEGLAFLYQEKLRSGETSRFFKFVNREEDEEEREEEKPGKKKGKSVKASGTTAEKPPMETTDAAKKKHLKLARNQGKALAEALHEMTQKKAHDGGERAAGHYLIGYAVEKAEGLYQVEDGELKWRPPEDENVHVEVSVRDGADGRFIPGLTVRATLVDPDGNEVGTHRQRFLWHPWLYHYGRNWKVPGDGTYTLRVRVEVPDFPRHDKVNGQRYTEPVEVEFQNVKIKTGQKK